MRKHWLLSGIIVWAVASTATAAGGGGGHDEGYEKVLLLFAILNFLIFTTVLYLLIRKPVREFLRHREQQLTLKMRETAEARARLERDIEQLDNRVAKLDDEAERTVNELIELGHKTGASAIADAKRQSAAFQQAANARIEGLQRELLREIVGELAERLAGRAGDEIRRQDTDKEALTEMLLARTGGRA